MDEIKSRERPARILDWIVGVLVAIFVVGLAWLISIGGVTPEMALWGDVAMILVPLVGLILIIIAAAMGRY